MKTSTEPSFSRRAALRGMGIGIALMASVAAGGCAPQSDDSAPRIIISGASGQVGGMVVEELLARGVDPADLILVSRTPEELERYAELGASTRFGDFLQPESLVTAYEGGDRMLLISLNSNNPDPRVPAQRVELQLNALQTAIEAGVEHVVYTSFVDADNNVSPIAEWHRATEADLRESEITWTALRNQWYMDGLVNQAVQIVEEGSVMVLPDDPGAAYVTRRDCAVAAAVALMTENENQVYEITGPSLVRVRDIAEIASEITGVEIEVIEAGPDDQVREPRPSGTTLSTHFTDLTGESGTTVRDLLEANRDVLVAAREG